MKILTRFWFRFEPSPTPCALNLGCGVTAYNHQDAVNLIREFVFKGTKLPPIVEMREDVDLSTLDQKHVLPNMDVPSRRGIWFPKGYGGRVARR